MALSGSVNTSSYDGRYYQFSWTATQSAANNRSTISWELKALGGDDSWYAERTLKLVAAGSTLYSKTDRVERYTGTIKTGSFYIDHATDGTASFSVSLQVAVYVSSVNCTASKTFTLNKIARASSLTASNGTLGTAQTLTITRQDSSFKHKITYVCGDVSGYAAGSSSDFTTETSISWTPPLSLAAQNTTGTSVSVTLYLKTYDSSGTQIGQVTKTITCSIPSSVKPTVSITISDPTGYLSTYGGYVQGKSKIKVEISASGSQSSTIKAYKTTANGKTYTGASVITDVVASSGTLTISTTVTDSRGRTATASKTITALAYAIPNLSKVSIKRCDSDGTSNNSGAYMLLTFTSAVSSLSNKNTATYTVQYKKSTEDAYTEETLTNYENNYAVSNGTFIFAAETGASYNVILGVMDAFSDNPVTRTITGQSIFKLFSWLASGTGWAFGKVAELANTVEFALHAKFNRAVYGNAVGLSYVPEIPSGDDVNNYLETGTWAVKSNEIAKTISNIPEPVGGKLENSSGLGMEINSTGWAYIRQKYTPYNGTSPEYIRILTRNASNVWSYGDWKATTLQALPDILPSELPSAHVQNVLWSGAYYMTSDHTITLSDSVQNQINGIVLVFSRYVSSGAENSNFNCFYIPKKQVSLHGGTGFTFTIFASNFAYCASKYLYVKNTNITGHANNGLTGTTNGVTYDNTKFCLRYVIGV